MKAERIIEDPVFQLNLLVWAAKEQPDNNSAVVTPVFSRRGYRLLYIENPFSFPVPLQLQLKDIDDIGIAPTADVVVANMERLSAFYIEAKKQSFGVGSSNCRQARAHLIAAGPAFTEVYPPINSCRLVYALPEKYRAGMETTLDALTVDVEKRGFKPGPFSVHGFGLGDKTITYVLDETSAKILGETNNVIPLLQIADDNETDPSPLLLIYTDSDSPNPDNSGFYRRVLADKIHAQLLCQLQRRDPSQVFAIKADNLLNETSDNTFQYAGKDVQKGMCVFVRDNIFKRIATFWEEKKPGMFQLDKLELTVRFGDEFNKEQFLEWFEDFKRTNFGDEPADPVEVATLDSPKEVQSELFSVNESGEAKPGAHTRP